MNFPTDHISGAQLEGFAAGELPDADCAAHLNACGRCRAELNSIVSENTLFSRELSGVAAPQEQPTSTPTAAAPRNQEWISHKPLFVYLVAASVMLAAALLLNYFAKPSSPVQVAVQPPKSSTTQPPGITPGEDAKGDNKENGQPTTNPFAKHPDPASPDTSSPALAAQVSAPHGKVLGINLEQKIVTLSVGTAKGVLPGHVYTISRGHEPVVQVTIDKVFPDLSTGRWIEDSLKKKDLLPAVGDDAHRDFTVPDTDDPETALIKVEYESSQCMKRILALKDQYKLLPPASAEAESTRQSLAEFGVLLKELSAKKAALEKKIEAAKHPAP